MHWNCPGAHFGTDVVGISVVGSTNQTRPVSTKTYYPESSHMLHTFAISQLDIVYGNVPVIPVVVGG
jgi:hypothetical protein